MKKKKIISTVLELVIVFAVFISMYSYVKKSIAPTKAYQYTKTIEAGEIINKDSIKEINIPKAGVNESFVDKPEEVVGKKAITKLVKGSFAYKEQVSDKGEVDPFSNLDWSTLRTVTVPVMGSVQENLRGEKVDLIYVGEAEKAEDNKDQGKSAYSKIFMQDVLVLSSSYDELSQEDKDEKKTTQGKNSNVTLAVTLDQAEEIYARTSTGSVGIVRRHTGAKNYETLGYIVGDFSKKYTGYGSAETGKSIPTEDTFNKENKN